MEWINVNHLLPKDKQRVLIGNYWKHPITDKVSMSEKVGTFNETDGYFSDNTNGKVMSTHWMPLPEPPETNP